VREDAGFFTRELLGRLLRRLPEVGAAVFSAGEIDCREGVGGPLYKAYVEAPSERLWAPVEAAIAALASRYVSALTSLFSSLTSAATVYLVPVLPHARRPDRSGRAEARGPRRRTIAAFNAHVEARCALSGGAAVFLDLGGELEGEDGCLREDMNCDGTHANNGIAGAVGRALAREGAIGGEW
jgi:hypothetical protein